MTFTFLVFKSLLDSRQVNLQSTCGALGYVVGGVVTVVSVLLSWRVPKQF